MTLDREVQARVGLEQLHDLVDDRLRLGPDVCLVEVEGDIERDVPLGVELSLHLLRREERRSDFQRLLLYDRQEVRVPDAAILLDVALDPDLPVGGAEHVDTHLVAVKDRVTMAHLTELEVTHVTTLTFEDLHAAQASNQRFVGLEDLKCRCPFPAGFDRPDATLDRNDLRSVEEFVAVESHVHVIAVLALLVPFDKAEKGELAELRIDDRHLVDVEADAR